MFTLLVAKHRWVAGQQGLFFIAPVLAVIAESHGFLLLVGNLDVVSQYRVLSGLPVHDRVGPQFLGFGHDIGAVGERIKVFLGIVAAPAGREKFVLVVPDVGRRIESRDFGVHVIRYRIGADRILRVLHFDVPYADQLAVVGVVIPFVGLHQVVFLRHGSPAVVASDVGQRVERKIIGVQRSVLVHHFDQRGIDARFVQQPVVVGLVAVDERAVLVDDHVAVTVHHAVAVPDCAVAGNDGPVVEKDDVPDQTQRRGVGYLDAGHHVGPEVHGRDFLPPYACYAGQQQHRECGGYATSSDHRRRII
ncbi:Uncharacterised protein [Alistipes sp. cv1]|nr:Uncharacterised protein [Faecalibacterium prausnitzii]